MAKEKNVNKKLIESGFNTNDLSLEKRMELANEQLTDFLTNVQEKMSVALDIELVFNKKGIVPRLIWVDVKSKDGQKNDKETTKKE